MQKKIKKKAGKKNQVRQARQVLTAAQEIKIRLHTTNQIMAAAAQVLTTEFRFTPDQCVTFSEKITEQIRANNQNVDETAVEGE